MRLWIAASCLLVLLARIDAAAQRLPVSAPSALAYMYKQLHGKLPPCADEARMRESADDVLWLYQRFGQTGWKNVDQTYVASLNDLYAALEKAAFAQRDFNVACESLRLVLQDLHVKREDCRALGHSRSKLPVEIALVSKSAAAPQGTPQRGWEVYAQWLPSGDRFKGAQNRLMNLSSPATGTVPVAGVYHIWAKDPSTGIRTEPERVSIGGNEIFHWTLTVPAQGQR
jgi:hypothetical protein